MATSIEALAEAARRVGQALDQGVAPAADDVKLIGTAVEDELTERASQTEWGGDFPHLNIVKDPHHWMEQFPESNIEDDEVLLAYLLAEGILENCFDGIPDGYLVVMDVKGVDTEVMALVSAADSHLFGTEIQCEEVGRWPIVEVERHLGLFITDHWDIKQGAHLRGEPHVLDFGYDEA